jgi:hypothetical protein
MIQAEPTIFRSHYSNYNQFFRNERTKRCNEEHDTFASPLLTIQFTTSSHSALDLYQIRGMKSACTDSDG